jgi:single-strand DNA-binding protein
MLNKIMLIGHLGRDPELLVTSEGIPYVRFSLAVNRRYKANGQTRDETQWFNIVVWRALAENCERYLYKGSKAYVEGRLQQRKYTDKNGIERTAVEVIATDVEFLTPRATSIPEMIIAEPDPFLPDFPDDVSGK